MRAVVSRALEGVFLSDWLDLSFVGISRVCVCGGVDVCLGEGVCLSMCGHVVISW